MSVCLFFLLQRQFKTFLYTNTNRQETLIENSSTNYLQQALSNNFDHQEHQEHHQIFNQKPKRFHHQIKKATKSQTFSSFKHLGFFGNNLGKYTVRSVQGDNKKQQFNNCENGIRRSKSTDHEIDFQNPYNIQALKKIITNLQRSNLIIDCAC